MESKDMPQEPHMKVDEDAVPVDAEEQAHLFAQEASPLFGGAKSPPEDRSFSTLTENHPGLKEREAEYFKRKEARLAKRSRARTPHQFLSSLPETENDIQYRFTFITVGHIAEKVITQACDDPPVSPSKVAHPMIWSCVARLERKEKLAKLGFQVMRHAENVPKYKKRQEVLSTVIIFTLSLDRGLEYFEEQLESMAADVETMRTKNKAKFRPVRAVLLCNNTSDDPDAGQTQHEETWSAALSDYESIHGELWKFGPLNLQDKGAVRAVFAEMADCRVQQLDDAPPEPEDAEEPHEEGIAEEEAEDLDDEMKDQFDMVETASTSGCSEGWHRPPVFEAEDEGSICSEGAMERHNQMFGDFQNSESDA